MSVEDPKSPVSDSYMSASMMYSNSRSRSTASDGGIPFESADGNGSLSPTKWAARLSDRIQHRLNKRGTTTSATTTTLRGSPTLLVSGGGGGPVSPRSESGGSLTFGTSRKGGATRSSNNNSNKSITLVEQNAATAASRQQKKKGLQNRSYEERVNSLLLKRQEGAIGGDDRSRPEAADVGSKNNTNSNNDMTGYITASSTMDIQPSEGGRSSKSGSGSPSGGKSPHHRRRNSNNSSYDTKNRPEEDSGDSSSGGHSMSSEDDDDISTHYSTPDDDNEEEDDDDDDDDDEEDDEDDDDDDDESSDSGGSSSEGSLSSTDEHSESSVSRRGDRRTSTRSVSPIYEGGSPANTTSSKHSRRKSPHSTRSSTPTNNNTKSDEKKTTKKGQDIKTTTTTKDSSSSDKVGEAKKNNNSTLENIPAASPPRSTPKQAVVEKPKATLKGPETERELTPADDSSTSSTEGPTTSKEHKEDCRAERPTTTTTTATGNHSTPSRGETKSASLSPQRSPRSRIPGGAAAKLMLLGPKTSDESSDGGSTAGGADGAAGEGTATDDVEIPKETVDEIGLTMSRSKTEFSTGSEGNRRYHTPSSNTSSRDDSADDVPTGSNADRSAPSDNTTTNNNSNNTAVHLQHSALFDRTEVFHQTATAAVVALLKPRSSNLQDILSVASTGAPSAVGGQPSEVQSALSMLSMTQSVVSSAFQAPTDFSTASPFESLARRDVSLQLITEETEKKLERLKDTMKDPNKTLADLLTAIHTSEDFEPDIGFTVRRKNACGALQVMTAQTERRVPIAWTVGVLPALTSVLRDTGEDGIHAAFPDKRHRIEFEAARNRAIACLMNLSMPPKNRIAIFHTPGLIQWLITICDEGQGIPRKGACAILAYLGKASENKLLMAQVPGLLDALERVLKPIPSKFQRSKLAEKKRKEKEYDSDDDGSGKEGNHSMHSSFSNESERTLRLSGSHSPCDIDGYDENADELLRVARHNVFALLIHLVKEKDNAYHLARHDLLTATLSAITNFHENPSHLLAVQILASLTRHRLNTKVLVFKQRDVVPALVRATTSKNDSTRLYACYALQNLAQDKSCRQELAVAPGLISAICDRSRKAKPEEERLAAVSAIKNLCDEPANLIPMTNTPDCIATLMHLAHGMEEGITELMQYRACDALATLSHWLRKIATSGQALENAKAKKPPPSTLFVPSLQVVDYEQWK